MTALGVAAPRVVAQRSLRMAAMAGRAPNARERREWERMHREKFAAFDEAARDVGREWLELQTKWMFEYAQPASTPWRWIGTLETWNSRWPHDVDRLFAAGVAPARRKAEANARRLARRSR